MHNFYSHCRRCFLDQDIFIEHLTSGQTYRYADLDTQSGKIAHYLSRLGLSKGDRVMVQVEKSPQNLFWYFACLRAGLIYLPLNTAYKAQELEYFLKDARPSLVLCDPSKLSLFQSLSTEVKFSYHLQCLDQQGHHASNSTVVDDVDLEGVQATNVAFEDITCDEDEVAVILYTSGTTGKPKGAMISHGNLIANSTALSKAWHWQHQDVMLHALPIFHIHGLFVATHLPVINSSTIIFLDKFEPEKVVALFAKATVYMGVPTHYVRLLNTDTLNQAACQNMRLFTSGSAPLLPQTFSAFQDRCAHTIVERYGMTETGMNTSNPIDGPKKAGTVGPVLEGVSAMILDASGEVTEAASPGDLYIKGANVFKGYWDMPEKTAEEFNVDGYFKTGDIASMDNEGYISIIGRDKDMIITGGLNVYPKELELIIDDIPGILESAVIGLPHADFGEAVSAVIVKLDPKAKPTAQDIITYMKARVADFKAIKQVFFIDELPRNTMGKVQKVLLRKMFS